MITTTTSTARTFLAPATLLTDTLTLSVSDGVLRWLAVDPSHVMMASSSVQIADGHGLPNKFSIDLATAVKTLKGMPDDTLTVEVNGGLATLKAGGFRRTLRIVEDDSPEPRVPRLPEADATVSLPPADLKKATDFVGFEGVVGIQHVDGQTVIVSHGDSGEDASVPLGAGTGCDARVFLEVGYFLNAIKMLDPFHSVKMDIITDKPIVLKQDTGLCILLAPRIEEA